MSPRQTILKKAYPLLIGVSKIFKRHTTILYNEKNVQPSISLYSLSFELSNGKTDFFSSYKNKKILIVNTASDCGYTNQYEALEKLYKLYADKLVIVAFPSNDFKEQETKDDNSIAEFCKVNYGVTFPLAKKSSVIKSANQNTIFEWLSSKQKNGWLNKAPVWNFTKYLINESGVLTHYFEPAIEPFDKAITDAINS